MYAGEFVASETSTNAATSQTGVYATSARTGVGTTTNQYGSYTSATLTSGTATNQWGLKSITNHNTTTAMTQQIAGDFSTSNTSTGTITTQTGLNVVMDNSGTVTTRYGVKILNTNTGTLTNTAFDIYAGTSTAYNYFAGNVGIGTTTPNSNLQVAGSVAYSVAAKTANYTLTASDYLVTADTSGGAFTLTLPTAVGITGRTYVVKRLNSNPSYILTIATTSSQTIDGAVSASIVDQWVSLTFVSDGANWLLI
jgi:hypothetical protein